MSEKRLMSFQELSTAAASLNKATDELTKTIDALDVALSRLNIGIPVWVSVVRWDDENNIGAYETEELGFAKIEGDWCIGIRRLVGHDHSPEPDEVREIWMFNAAPRDLRLRAINELPTLLDELGNAAKKTAEAVNKKLAEARAFTAALGIGSTYTPTVQK
jgi:hypothetical protein